MVALQKPNGGVRGLVIGDVLRRVVSRCLAQMFATNIHAACSPHQFALSTRAGTGAIIHALNTATQHNTATTVLSIDGVGAYDTISRTSMLHGLFNTPAANQCLRVLVVCHGVGIRLARWIVHAPFHHISGGWWARRPPHASPILPGTTTGPTSCPSPTPARRTFVCLPRWRLCRRTARQGPPRVRPASPPPRSTCQHPPQPRQNQNLEQQRPPTSKHWHVGPWHLGRRPGSPTRATGPYSTGGTSWHRTVCPAIPEKHIAQPPALTQAVAWHKRPSNHMASPRSNYLLRLLPPAQTIAFAASHDLAISQCLSQLLPANELPVQALARAHLPHTCPSLWNLRPHEYRPFGISSILGILGWRHTSLAPASATGGNRHPPAFRTAGHSTRPHPGSTSSAPVNPGTGMGTPQLATTSCPAATARQRRIVRRADPTRLATTRGSPSQHRSTSRPLYHTRPSQPSHPGFTIRSIRQQNFHHHPIHCRGHIPRPSLPGPHAPSP